MSSYKPLYPSTAGKKGQVRATRDSATTQNRDIFCYSPTGEGGGLICFLGTKTETDQKAQSTFKGISYSSLGSLDAIKQRIEKFRVGNFLYLKR